MNCRIALLSLLLLVAGLAGCARPVARCASPEDNPQHHYLMGMEALDKGKIDVAQEKFARAIYCDDGFSKAHGGLAIVAAEKAREQADAEHRGVEAKRSLEHLGNAEKQARTDDDRFGYYVASIRVHTLLKGKGWLNKAEDAFKEGSRLKVDERELVFYQGKEAIGYLMGMAYLEALEFQKARDSFSNLLNAKREGKWHERAEKGWKKVDRIVRAMSGITVGDVGKRIAVKDAVTRADLAALLIDEMKIDKLFAGRIPVASQVEGLKAEFTPADTLGSQFREEILTILKWKVRGMEPKYDENTKAYLFFPADPVKRGEMAFILEDVLIRLTGDNRIATAYFGHEKSPFPDVRPTSSFYNAIMNMTTRGIMEGELSGEFRVNAPVEGAEALLAIRVLKQRMNTY